MKIHEFQAKQVLSRYGVPVPRSKVAESVEEAFDAARELGGEVWVVKAQIHAGGRGKGGGVKVCRGLEEVRENAEKILGMQLVTKQTGPAGQKVLRVLIEEGMEIIKEYYDQEIIHRGLPIYIGANPTGRMKIFHGLMDDFRLYDRALNLEEVSNLMICSIVNVSHF